MPNLSSHSVKRCRQRGIDPAVVELLVMLGVDIEMDNKASKLAFSKREKKHLLRVLKRCSRAVEKAPYAVLAHTGEVITVAHKYN
jgi:hypothetical protein